MGELGNIFTHGSQALIVESVPKKLPVNEDWAFLGFVTAFDEVSQKVTVTKAWDLAAVPSAFYAYARHPGNDEAVTSDLVTIGQLVPVFRCGAGNNDFSSTSALQKHDLTDTSNPSFVCFFF